MTQNIIALVKNLLIDWGFICGHLVDFATSLRGLPTACWDICDTQCAIKEKCTPGEQRRVTRWENEEILEAMQARLDERPDSMRIRRQTVEHPFGTLKLWMGNAHFLTRTLARVSTEMSLHVLAHNLKRVMKLLGTGALMEAMVA